MIGVVVDMNLPPYWAASLRQSGWTAIHWSEIGPTDATDAAVMKWAADRDHVVITQDLDFPALLAATQARAPSVIVVRTPDVLEPGLVDRVAHVLSELRAELDSGAIVSVGADRRRVRVLPL